MSRIRPSFRLRAAATCLAAACIGTAFAASGSANADKPERYSILVFTATAGFFHPSIPPATEAIIDLGEKKGFAVDVTDDPTDFTPENLDDYEALVFLSTTGNVLPEPAQRAALEGYIQDGGGWLGVHAASDMGATVRNGWPWYRELVGAAFKGHTNTRIWADDPGPYPGAIYAGPLADAPDDADSFGALRYSSWEPALVDVEVVNSPAMRGWGQQRIRTDEWYGFLENPRDHVHVLASVDEGSYDPGAGDMGPGDADHPVVWCQDYDGGRSVYTALGHTTQAWSDHAFMKHIQGSIEMAAGVTRFDC